MKCVVCSVPTTTWRYEVFACNACANFFRRIVIEEKELKCTSGRAMQSRECYDQFRCRGCRFRVCEDVGMCKDSVRFNFDRRKVQIKEEIEDDIVLPSILPNPPTPEVFVDRVIKNLKRIEHAYDRLRHSTYNPLPNSIKSINEALEGPSKLSTEFGEMQDWPLSSIKPMNDNKRAFKDRIRDAFVPECYMGNRKSWYFSNLIYAIEYFKTFHVFESLGGNTKRLLAAKMSLLCSNLTNAFFSMEKGANFTLNPDGTSMFEGMQKGELTNLPIYFQAFYRDLQVTTTMIRNMREMKFDENEYVLLKALLIMSPSIDDASESERALLTKQSECYAKSLLSYILAKRGVQEGPKAYAEILGFVDTISHKTRNRDSIQDSQVLMGALGIYAEMCPLLEEVILT